MSNNQKYIQRARLALHDQRREEARARRDEKKAQAAARVKADLLLDDLENDGIDTTTPYGKAMMLRTIAEKIADAAAKERGPLDDGNLFFRD